MTFPRLLAVMLLLAAAVAAQSNPVPFINNPLVPDAVAPGGPDLTLTVNGAGFVSGSVVNWNGSALPTAFVSVSQFKALIDNSLLAVTTSGLVTVRNPGINPSSNAVPL